MQMKPNLNIKVTLNVITSVWMCIFFKACVPYFSFFTDNGPYAIKKNGFSFI